MGAWPRVGLLLRAAAERFGLVLLLLLALLLVLLGKADLKLAAYLGNAGRDAVVPVLGALTRPVAALRQGADQLGGMLALEEANARLRLENRRLLVWQAEAARLAVENGSLRQVLKMPAVEEARLWTTVRIVADPGGPFVRTLLIDAGADRGIETGMAVVEESGMLGRVVAVGQRSARVLLITDLNSKVPVITERSRDQAVLEGTNDRRPELRFPPMNPSFSLGDRVLTSGRGGVLPAGLLIGEIAEIRDQHIVVRPFVDWDRLDYVAVLRRPAVRGPEATELGPASVTPLVAQADAQPAPALPSPTAPVPAARR